MLCKMCQVIMSTVVYILSTRVDIGDPGQSRTRRPALPGYLRTSRYIRTVCTPSSSVWNPRTKSAPMSVISKPLGVAR